MKRIIFSAIVCAFFTISLFAQENILRGMLDLPAPPPVAESEDKNVSEKSERPDEFYKKENVPPDDAPTKDLIDFWKRQNNLSESHPDKIEPSEKTLERLIESLEEKPENLANFLNLIPISDKIAAAVKEIYDAHGLNFDEGQRGEIENWLKYKSSYYSDELLAEARNAKDHKSYDSVIKEKELRALAKVDWEKVKPLLERSENDPNNPITAFFAKRLIYEHALETGEASSVIEKYRKEFQKIVEDKNAAGRKRDAALEALIENEDWQGSVDWYVSLFSDQTLLELKFGENEVSHPLTSIAAKNPDRWIPILAELVGNKNRAMHNAAVQGLVQFQNRTARKDALEPLLPWISNPDWAADKGMGRLRLIQSMSEVDMPESVLHLIRAVETDEYYAKWAAESLIKYKDARAIPSLKIGLQKAQSEEDRPYFYRALMASGGFSVEEQAAAIETYAEKISNAEGFKEVEQRYFYGSGEFLPMQVSLGKYLANQTEPDENLILRVIERQKILQKEKPETAKILSGIMAKWQNRLVDLEMLRKISEGKADLQTINNALERRVELKERVPNNLYLMRGKIGLPGALAACLLMDENEILSAFHSQNVETQIGTLACARLIRARLPVHEVENYLNSPNKLLALAAERYLISEDGIEARNLVLAKYKGEALILGARTSFDPKNSSDSDYYGSKFDKVENLLRKEVLENENLKEVFAFGAHSIRVYADKAVYRRDLDDARFRERVLTNRELEAFHRKIIEKDIYNRPPVRGYCHHDCAIEEFVILNRNGGRRLFMFADYSKVNSFYFLFPNMPKDDAKLHYRLSDKIKGLEVLIADEKYSPRAIWKNEDDFRVLVEDKVKEKLIEEEIERLDKIDDENEELDWEEEERRSFGRKAERAVEHFEWHKFENGKIGARIGEPAEIPFLKNNLTFPAIKDLRTNEGFQTTSGNYEIRAGEYNKGSLWKINSSQQIEFKKGNYSNPVVGGNWVVAAKTDKTWAIPNYIVRINLQTGKEYKINLPPADNFHPIAYIPAHKKVLLYRAKDDYEYTEKKDNPSPEKSEFYLLDAATGQSEIVKGEFRPLVQQTFRSLQKTGKSSEFWAAIYDNAKNQTEIGRYDAKNFRFETILEIPEISLDSMDIWVDEKAEKVYFVYQGSHNGESHLLGLPLAKKKK